MKTTFSQWRPHPWHGLEAGREPPRHVNAYIEITPFELIKYEIDKASGYLRVDRPQRPARHWMVRRTPSAWCAPPWRITPPFPEPRAG